MINKKIIAILYIDAYQPQWQKKLEISSIKFFEKNILEIYKNRFSSIKTIDRLVLAAPQNFEDRNLINFANNLKIEFHEYTYKFPNGYNLIYFPERWNLEDDICTGTIIGNALYEVAKKYKATHLIFIPITNILVDRFSIEEALNLHFRENFEITFTYDRVYGANFFIINSDVLLGLSNNNPDIMDSMGGLIWAIKKPLYPFNIGEYHLPRNRPIIYPIDLRLNNIRSYITLSQSIDQSFITPTFNYTNWISNLTWLQVYYDYAPKKIYLEPSNICSASCYACPYPFMSRPKSNIDLNLVQKISQEIFSQKDLRIIISGMGEPFNHPHLDQIVNLLKDHFILMQTSLNVMPSHNNFPYQNLTQIRFSVDAIDPISFANIRVGCSWTNIQNFIASSYESKVNNPSHFPDIGISFVKHNQNSYMAKAFIEYWKKVCTPPYKEYFFNPNTNKPLDKVQWAQILGFSSYLNQIPFMAETNYTPLKRRPCLNCLETLCILSDGSVTLCKYDFNGKFIIGNIKDQSIFEIWNSDKLKKIRIQQLKIEFDNSLPCYNCTDWYHKE